MTQARLNTLLQPSCSMRPLPKPATRSAGRLPSGSRHALACLAVVLVLTASPARAAQPFIWDQDTNGIDDRIELVDSLGFSASFELGDTTLRQRILVTRVVGGLLYSVYVRWDHTPTASDVAALALLGMPVLARIEAVPASRSVATFAQVKAAAALPGVQRVEAVPLLYPENRDGTAAIGVRDPTDRVFPTFATRSPGSGGHGVVVAFLDTGINDAPEGTYPGHEALAGRCLGGALFITADSLSQTPRDGSVNPADHGGQATHSHATHVAATAVGAGGAGGYAAGVAPLAKFVDVKVLNDAGSGIAVPEALDWCISNRARDWGSLDPDERGIDVINLSLSSPDQSDGQDLASQLAARAVQLGIVVVASMGNGGLAGHVPSPAAGDGVIAVGAWSDARTPEPGDDSWPGFNNTGPRASDGDADATDELKPDLLAPGVDVLSANGDVTTDGTRFQRLSGTSMACAFVSGVCALLRESATPPSPAQIAQWLRNTARRPLPGAPAGSSSGADPRWRSTIGFGLVDAYAAALERDGTNSTQIRRLALTSTDTTVTATLWTGREVTVSRFVFDRSPDTNGVPLAFAPVDSVPATGLSSLNGPVSYTEYTHTWIVPPAERGARFWYRVSISAPGVRITGPAVAFTSPTGTRVATLEVTIVHDAYDSDIGASVRAGGSGPVFELPGTAGATSSDWLDGSSFTGTQAWTFQLPVPAGPAGAFLPPSDGSPWTLTVNDGGSITHSGRVTDFKLTWQASGGDQVFTGGPLPKQTVEGGSIQVRIPSATSGVDGAGPGSGLRVQPNPARSGHLLRFTLPPAAGGEARVFDITGSEVARVRLTLTATGWQADWQARGTDGRALPPGLYFVRGRAGPASRVVLLDP